MLHMKKDVVEKGITDLQTLAQAKGWLDASRRLSEWMKNRNGLTQKELLEVRGGLPERSGQAHQGPQTMIPEHFWSWILAHHRPLVMRPEAWVPE